MAIPVTCPACFKRFNVSDQFAGRTGPCPSCQKPIKIPEKSEEVVIHAPENSGPKDSKGRSVLKPLRRKEVNLSLPVILGAALTTLVVFGVALGIGLSGDRPPSILMILGSIVLALPLSYIGYWFLHDDELEGFTGQQLLIRVGVCGLAFAASWGVYAFIPTYVNGYTSTAEMTGLDMVMFIPLMILLGTIVSVAAMELEVVQGILHYMFYFGITFILAWLSGAPLGEPLGGPEAITAPPSQTAPANPGKTEKQDTKPQDEKPKIPNLLQ